jgi:Family of unknown function (DUF6361)
MKPVIGWTMFSRKEMRDAERFLQPDTQGVRDEIGFLQIHQGFADRFFPGTSVLHTRIRYVHFIPWIYTDAAAKRGRGSDLRSSINRQLLQLTDRLRRGDKKGVIGGDIYPRQPAQPADTVYWSALRNWGILLSDVGSRGEAIRRLYEQGKQTLQDDEGVSLNDDPTEVFRGLPDKPENWSEPGTELNFKMSADERKSLRKQLGKVLRPDSDASSLLSELVKSQQVFEDASELPKALNSLADADDKKALTIARDAAGLAAIGRTVYGALVEMLRERDGISDNKEYRKLLSLRFDEYGEIAGNCDLENLGKLIPAISAGLGKLLHDTQEYVIAGKPEDFADLLGGYEGVEWQRKQLRARIKNHARTNERRKEWQPEQHNTDPLHYRWYVVRNMLRDLNG